MDATRLLLKRARRTKVLTQSAVADQLGVTIRTYQRYESGERNISLDVAAKLATLLDISIYDLVGRNSSTKSVEDESEISEHNSA